MSDATFVDAFNAIEAELAVVRMRLLVLSRARHYISRATLNANPDDVTAQGKGEW